MITVVADLDTFDDETGEILGPFYDVTQRAEGQSLSDEGAAIQV